MEEVKLLTGFTHPGISQTGNCWIEVELYDDILFGKQWVYKIHIHLLDGSDIDFESADDGIVIGWGYFDFDDYEEMLHSLEDILTTDMDSLREKVVGLYDDFRSVSS